MPKITIHNESEERIVIEPGESVKLRGTRETRKSLSARRDHFHSEEIWNG